MVHTVLANIDAARVHIMVALLSGFRKLDKRIARARVNLRLDA
jgi:hypothetical protein